MTATAVLAVLASQPAQASCDGRGRPFVEALYVYNPSLGYYTLRATETPRDESCNGNSIYTGWIQDEVDDGYCAYAIFFDPGQSVNGRDCTTRGAAAPFTFWDQQSNSSADECVSLQSTCGSLSTGRFLTWGF